MKNWKDDFKVMCEVLNMFAGPILMLGLIAFAVSDSMGIRTVMHVIAENWSIVPLAYVGIMFATTLHGFYQFNKEMDR